MDNRGFQPDGGAGPFAIARFPAGEAHPNANYLVEVNSRAKIFRRPHFYRNVSIVSLAVALVFLVLLVVLTVFYFSHLGQYGRICTSDECLRSAANLRYSIDFARDPCDDFYRFACGRWSAEHPNHGWFPTFSAFSTITERVLINAESLLTAAAAAAGPDEPGPVEEARALYRSCMNPAADDALGVGAMFQYLIEAELPIVPAIFNRTDHDIAGFRFNWLRADAVVKKLFAMDLFVGFSVETNSYNRSENVMFIGTPAMKSPLPAPLRGARRGGAGGGEDYYSLRRNANERIIKFILVSIVINATAAPPDMEVVNQATEVLLNMTKTIDELIVNYTMFYDDSEPKPYSIDGYQKFTNDFLSNNNITRIESNIYEMYLSYLFEGTNVTINASIDLLYINDEEYDYLPKIFSYLMTTSDVYAELYVWWSVVYAMIFNTSTQVKEYITKELAPFQSGEEIARTRSIECSSLVNSFMGMAVSYGIADRLFSNQTKPKVEEMLYNIKEAFVEKVNSISWMDAATKRATLEKSREMISFIGYPEWLFEEGALEAYYEGVAMSENHFLDNMMNMVRLYVPSRLRELRTVNQRDWKTDPTTVNAFNSFPDNAINVPMAILSFPIYNLGLEALNYGGIGSILGHELTHGFDNAGRKHDKYGNYKQWWTNETIETFEEKTRCFVKQYDNFTIEGIEQRHIYGDRTLGENLADNGGLNHAFVAYKNYVKRNGHEGHLPGFENFSNEQMFFIAFGSIWCETSSIQNLEEQIEYDEHCPNSIRVLGTLQNSDDFARAFNCPAGSKMNPKRNKCKIW